MTADEKLQSQRAAALKWSRANAARKRDISEKWRKDNLERVNAISAKAKLTRQELIAGRLRPKACEVCGDGRRTLHFDHCHITGAFRGWICHGCNVALGLVNDSPATLDKLAAYLRAFDKRTAT